jgi:hypothetical protein
MATERAQPSLVRKVPLPQATSDVLTILPQGSAVVLLTMAHQK